jgi:DNA-binding transcriptional ArsR family regulator
MSDARVVAEVAGLLGDESRATMCLTMLDGGCWTVSELADAASVGRAAASEHVARLADGGLVETQTKGRHKYVRLAGPHVAELLERLGGFGEPAPPTSLNGVRDGRRLAAARTCYDHLAGRLGTALMDALIERGVLVGGDGRFDPHRARRDRLSAPGRDVDYQLTDLGARRLLDLGIDVAQLPGRRPLVRYCIDWSEQRHHLAGGLGAALCSRLFELGWIRRADRSRAVHLTADGEDGLERAFGVRLERLEAA